MPRRVSLPGAAELFRPTRELQPTVADRFDPDPSDTDPTGSEPTRSSASGSDPSGLGPSSSDPVVAAERASGVPEVRSSSRHSDAESPGAETSRAETSGAETSGAETSGAETSAAGLPVAEARDPGSFRAETSRGENPEEGGNGRTRGSGRVRHDEKITVYVSAEELLALERARLVLRADHQLAVDRGRIVREALALALEDLDAHGGASVLVRRLGTT